MSQEINSYNLRSRFKSNMSEHKESTLSAVSPQSSNEIGEIISQQSYDAELENSRILQGSLAKTMSTSCELSLLMKSFFNAEKRLIEFKQELWALIKDTETEEIEISDLIEQCEIVISDPEFACLTILASSKFSDSAKVRAQNCLHGLHKSLEQN